MERERRVGGLGVGEEQAMLCFAWRCVIGRGGDLVACFLFL